ncbi:MAG: ribonuclease H-like YkuK family protein [Acetobacteraceae bacterium]|nr:ribonuclease H-like YkuK family protein [Acetobacteraceae bacterium]
MEFISPTKGGLTFEAMFRDIIEFVTERPAGYRLIIGTDSHSRDDTSFVTAVVIHRMGKGARYYYQKRTQRQITSLRQRIFYETSLSLGVAGRLAEKMAQNGYSDLDVEIHLDVGPSGETKELIREIVGMVTGSGFDAKIKPDSYGASKVADKHTK